ncbi:gas vesicle protein [Oikeobacillus pervagus]|uniref:Gas vesicle protein n=1 Tax=Oikeobacillus pervagus TaxID=1325931 RepID=A0AAJ1WK51_9BACI|nr:YtxH domain-containing protein [Oikeobacillus pervagus]MDQ0214756.1 gas vesicle protein [Oikeobacillus pervagus]
MDKKSLTYGFLIGGAISAVTTLLITPSSGKDIQLKFKTKKQHLKESSNQLKGEVLQLKQSVVSLAKEGKSAFNQLSTDLKSSIELWQKNIEPNKDAIQNELEEIKKSIDQLENTMKM